MAQIPASTSRKFSPSDYRTAPDWFSGRFLSQLNLFVDPVYNALQNNLTFQQNFNAQYFTQQITAGATADKNAFSFKQSIFGSPKECVKVACNVASNLATPILNAVDISWYADAGTIHITAVTGLTAGTVYNLTLRVN